MTITLYSQMTPSPATGGLGFHKATIDVPASAWGMDMVFTDNGQGIGGFQDNNGRMDYHVEVSGARA